MTDKPYQGRKGGSYVRASRNDPPRRVEETTAGTAPDAAQAAQPDTGADDAAHPETTSPETGTTAGKAARKRS